MQSHSQSDTVPLHFLNNPNNSINQTAFSIEQQVDLDADDTYAEQILQQFYSSQLKIHADMRFQQLQNDQNLFSYDVIAVYPPEPLVYFLPYTIMVNRKEDLTLIRDRIKEKYKSRISAKQIQLNMYVDSNQQLFISLHTSSELVFYKIRRQTFQNPQQFHIFPDCLDKDILVDRLYNFYKKAYEKFYFEEVSVFFFYWAYIKKFLIEDYISPSAIKIIVIWMYIDFGYGIENVLISFQKNFWSQQKKCLQMARTNKKGECIIDKQISRYQNYSISQKKGLYIISQKKYQIIRLISPILFPIGKRNKLIPRQFQYRSKQLQYYKKKSQQLYKKLLRKNHHISRYKLLIKLMKNMHKYFNSPDKIIFDLKRQQMIFIQSSNQFLLKIQHPVFQHCLSKSLAENGSAARRIKCQLNELIRKAKDSVQAVDNIKEMFQKK